MSIVVNRAVMVAMCFAVCGIAQAQTADVMKVETQPPSVPVGTPTMVRVTATIPANPALIRTSVTLARYDEASRVVAPFGSMYDDGSHGDATAGDSVFTAQIIVNEAAPSILWLRASAAYQRQLKRVLSDAAGLLVVADATAQTARSGLVASLRAGNLAAAYSKLSARLNRNGVLTRLSAADREQLVTALNTCVVIQSEDDYEVCEGQVQELGVTRTLQFTFLRDGLGTWRVLGW